MFHSIYFRIILDYSNFALSNLSLEKSKLAHSHIIYYFFQQFFPTTRWFVTWFDFESSKSSVVGLLCGGYIVYRIEKSGTVSGMTSCRQENFL